MPARSHMLDIYGAWLHLATDKRQWSALRRQHKGVDLVEDLDSDGICQFVIHTDHGTHTPHLFMFLNVKTHGDDHLRLTETCAHEATHAAAQLFDHIGQKGGDSEALAYLVGWLTRWLYEAAT
jgi:hypothetical protein